MSDIFVSYKHARRGPARQLVSALAARGWDVWWDWNIPAGNDWKAELDAQLDAAGCVLVLWAGDSAQSDWVLYEARHAQQAGKLVQAMLEPTQPPGEFAALQAVDLAGWVYGAPFHGGFDKLRAAIRDILERRAPLATTRSDTLIRTPGEAGDVLRRDKLAAAARARPAPVMLLPPPFPDLLDRTTERAAIAAALAERRNVSLAGEEGSGKSALLQYVGNVDHTERFHDGVVYLTAAAQSENDLAQSVHEVFYDVSAGVHSSAVQMRRNLADKTALLMLDDAALPVSQLDSLNTYAPSSCWVFAAPQPAASARRRPVVLKGLPVEDGVALFERTLSRPLSAAERSGAERIVLHAQGHPGRIEQAAGVAAVQGIDSSLAGATTAPDLRALDAKSRRVLAALTCGGEIPLESEQCAAIAHVDGVDDVLAALLRRGLVQHVPAGFRLSAGLAPQLAKSPEFLACNGRATGVFVSFAFEARGTPRRIARLAAPMLANMAWAAANSRGIEALQLARAIDAPLANANRWDAWRDMLKLAHDIAIRIGDLSTAGWALHQLGTREILLGDNRAARRLLKEAGKVRKRGGDAAGLEATRANLKLVGWARWTVLIALLSGLGVTTLSAVLVAPYFVSRADIAPTSIDFGAQDLRAVAQPKAVRIENRGNRPLEVIDVTLQGSNATAFRVGPSCDRVTIPPKFWCILHAHFVPEGIGPRNAIIAIRTRDREAAYAVPLQGTGSAAPIAQLSAEAVDFGQVEIGGASASRSINVRNSGSAPLVLTKVAVDGDGAFNLVHDGCQGAAIEPDAQCAIDLRFSPREAMPLGAKLVIADNASGSPRAVPLSGTGHATPKFEVSPENLAFGRQEVGTQSPPKPIRLRNTGTVQLVVQRVALEASGAFPVQGSCDNVTLAPGSDCVLQLKFAPTAIETSRGRLVIAHSTGNPRTVDLTGEGFGRALVDVTPAQIDFGGLKPGAEPPAKVVTIDSRGTDALRLEPPKIEGDGGFSVVNRCPARLAPKQKCVMEISFRSAAAGKSSARLVVAHNAEGGRSIVALSAAVEAIAPPEIVRFDGRPPSMQGPGETQLCFAARNAQQVTIQPGDPQPSSANGGCVARALAATTTFTLTARGEGGASRQSNLTITVASLPDKPPAIVRFDARPSTLQAPGQTQLCFAASDAQQVSIQPGDTQPSSPDGGCVPRTLATSTTYTLTVRGAGGSSEQRRLTVTVGSAPDSPPAIVRFDAKPMTLQGPGQTQLCFAASDAQQVSIQPGDPQPQSPSDGCVPRRLSATTAYTLTVRGKGGKSEQRKLTVTVAAAPDKSPAIVRFDANPATLKGRGQTQLCFVASNAQNATIQPGDPQPQSPNGGCVLRNLSVTTSYTLTVGGKGGPSLQRRLTVEVPKTPGPPVGGRDQVVPRAGAPVKKEDLVKKENLVKKEDLVKKEAVVKKPQAPVPR